MNKKMVLGAMVVAAIGLGIYGYKVLPEMVTVQVDLSGNPSNTYPKVLAIASQSVLTIGGGIGYYFSKERQKSFLILAIVGILVSVITLVYNT
ncbi:DUF1648 domain-containing protein [Aedoeadaptatus pacaensis]|uniref:DUF1648 domain-containing protein n=1 Tax=Aedoeadaptatus pacaensis TaxID=1776390 RepID=UPI0008385B9A|nr:DUF1648 domain-containing protein [Peptoniphilus pacaensis]